MTTDATAVAERTDEQTAKDQKQADADFAKGFAKGKGADLAPAPKSEAATESTDTTTQTTDAQDTVDGGAPKSDDMGADTASGATPAAAAPAAAAPAEPAKDPWEGVPAVVRQQLEDTAKRVRNVEGHIGGINSKLGDVVAKAKADVTKAGGEAPSDTQVKAALTNPAAWKQLKEDFPDWAGPIEAEFSALRAEIAKAAKPTVDVDGIKTALRGELRDEILGEVRAEIVEEKYPAWKQTVASTEFSEWRKTQPAEVNALGASDKPKDAIRMLDLFEDHKKQVAAAAADRAKKDRRLASAEVPKGTSSSTASAGISDDAAFARGFNRAKGK